MGSSVYRPPRTPDGDVIAAALWGARSPSYGPTAQFCMLLHGSVVRRELRPQQQPRQQSRRSACARPSVRGQCCWPPLLSADGRDEDLRDAAARAVQLGSTQYAHSLQRARAGQRLLSSKPLFGMSRSGRARGTRGEPARGMRFFQ
jgi:hypothetical protein